MNQSILMSMQGHVIGLLHSAPVNNNNDKINLTWSVVPECTDSSSPTI